MDMFTCKDPEYYDPSTFSGSWWASYATPRVSPSWSQLLVMSTAVSIGIAGATTSEGLAVAEFLWALTLMAKGRCLKTVLSWK